MRRAGKRSRKGPEIRELIRCTAPARSHSGDSATYPRAVSAVDVAAPTTAGLRIGLGVRPPRVAIGVPPVRGISWKRLFEAAIAAQTRTWGGSGNLPFPLTPRFTNSDLFWELADRFDADAFATYVPNVADMELLDRKWFAATEQQARAQLADESTDVVDDYLERRLETEVIDPPQPTERQLRELYRRLAPLNQGGPFNFEWVTSRAPAWPLVDVASFAGLPNAVSNPVTVDDPTLRLLMTTE